MCCIIETLVRRDRSGKWSEHGRRARVIYNLETLGTKGPKTGFRTSATFYMVPATELGPTHFLTYRKNSDCSPHHKYHARTNAVSTKSTPIYLVSNRKDRERYSQFSNMWQLSNLQIDSSVIQIVQSDVLRNSVDTTAAITNSRCGAVSLLNYWSL